MSIALHSILKETALLVFKIQQRTMFFYKVNAQRFQQDAPNTMEQLARFAIMAIICPMEPAYLATVQLKPQLIISNTIAQFH